MDCKEKYIKPKVNIEKFEKADVLTSSTQSDNDSGWTPYY